ncbi:hypothetical protein [Mesorhizobium sp. 1B3]|uniref:hypothetical protein n=1 Tax=Mesorhizobium sp. 1B3 TaxID=3243599 RepID=UPI003D9805A6
MSETTWMKTEASPVAATAIRFPWRLYTATFLIASMWIHASENFRYLLFVRPMLQESLSMVPDVAPMNLAVFVSWGIWDTVLSAMTVLTYWLYAQVFGPSVRSAVVAGTISWLSSFVFFWHAFANLNLATVADLIVEPSLSWVELVVASLIARWCFGSSVLARLVGERRAHRGV